MSDHEHLVSAARDLSVSTTISYDDAMKGLLRLTNIEQIVRELAESEAIIWTGNGSYACPFCDYLGEHESDCLWLRAKQAVERE